MDEYVVIKEIVCHLSRFLKMIKLLLKLFIIRSVILFQETEFAINVSEGLIKKQFAFPGKTVHRKQLLPGEHFYFNGLQLPIKVSKFKS